MYKKVKRISEKLLEDEEMSYAKQIFISENLVMEVGEEEYKE